MIICNDRLSDTLLRSDLMQECLLNARGFLFVPIACFANTKRYLKKYENTWESLVLALCASLFSPLGSTAIYDSKLGSSHFKLVEIKK